MPAAIFLFNHSTSGVLQGKFRLQEGRSIVGRSARADLVLSDGSVSRRHAELIVVAESLTVRDLNSRNGTFVDDERVTESAVLPRQRLRFGSVEFLLSNTDAPHGDLAVEEETADVRHTQRLARLHPSLEVLTAAQRRVFDLLMRGQPQKVIAKELGVSPHTVHNHTRVIYRAFGVHTRAELMARVRPQPD